MIGSDLEGADLESRAPRWAASAVGQYTGSAAVMPPELETVVGSQLLRRWKITQYMYQQMLEQSGGVCSGI